MGAVFTPDITYAAEYANDAALTAADTKTFAPGSLAFSKTSGLYAFFPNPADLASGDLASDDQRGIWKVADVQWVAIDDDNVISPLNIAESSMDLDNGKIYVGNVSNQATQQTISGAITMNNTGVTTLADDSVTLQKLAPAIRPESICVYADIVAGNGATTDVISVPFVLATDIAIVSINTSENAASLQKSTAVNGGINVLWSSEPGTGTTYNVIVMRRLA
jgi:hypothetical protein